MWGDTRRSRTFLGIAFAARIVIALGSSYLHPDEHLQGPQEVAHGNFGWASQYAWEFKGDQPLRSYILLWLAYGIPMSFFSSDSNPVYVLYTLRAVFFTLTWVLEDMAVDRLANTRNDKLRCLFFVSTSYVTLTWQAHTLSNSLETVLVLWFLVILHEADSASVANFMSPFDRHYDNVIAGIIVVIGIFNRPTFLAFLLLPSLRFIKLWYRNPSTLISFSVTVALVTAFCIYTDTLLYGSQNWIITPLNFIRYNLSSDNLSDHGTHSRWTHLIVNIPQLLGPGLVLLRPPSLSKPRTLISIPLLSIISGLCILSYFPHQEARFLLPLVPLFCVQMDFDQFKSEKLQNFMLYAWMAFNLLLGTFMGVFHQAGVIPAQVQVRDFSRPSTVLWWKTYTPPLWVTGLQAEQVRYAELGVFGEDVAGAEKFLATTPATESRQDNEHDRDHGRDHDREHNKEQGSDYSKRAVYDEDVLTVLDLQGAAPDVMYHLLEVASERDGDLFLVAPLAKLHTLQKYFDPTHPLWRTFFHIDPDMLDLSDLSTFMPGLGIWNVTALI